MYKKLLAVILIILAIDPLAVLADDGLTVTIDGVRVEFANQTPVISDGRTLVPLRGVFELLGFTVDWDTNAAIATFTRADYTVQITVGSSVFFTNGTSHVLEAPAQIINGRTMLPLRAVLESIGYGVTWSETARTTAITTPRRVSTVAGTGAHGYLDGTAAQFNLPANIFSDGTGTIFVADTYNNLIRRITTDGNVTTHSGEIQDNDEYGFPLGRYRGGALSQALFNRPTGGAVAPDGSMFIADSENHIIRTIIGNTVSTFASETDFRLPTALVLAPNGSIYFTDTLNHVIRRIDSNGNTTTVAGIPGEYGFRDGNNALFNSPMGIAIAQNGAIFVADTGNHLIRVIENGNVRTLAGTLQTSPDFDNEPIGGFADGFNAMFDLPTGLAIWNETLIIADSANHRIRAILPTGETVTLAGTGYPDDTDGAALSAAFQLPRGVYVLGDLLYIADTGNNQIRVMPLN